MKKSILITGGAGYIGSMLTPSLLADGYSVTVIDNLLFNQSPLNQCCANKNFRFICGDTTNASLMSELIPQFDIILPLAAMVGAPACDADAFLTERVNVTAYRHIIDLLSDKQQVVFPTTNSGYGIGPADDFCTEDTPLCPVSLYGKTKVLIENELLSTGNAVTLRLATVFGMSPRMRTDLLVNNFVYKAVTDKSLVLFEEHFRRNFIHVQDVCRTFHFALGNYEIMRGQAFNVGLTSANLTKRELAERIKRKVPDLYIHSAAIGTDPDKRDYIVSNAKLEALGWQPQVSLDDGIDELIKGYRFLRPGPHKNA